MAFGAYKNMNLNSAFIDLYFKNYTHDRLILAALQPVWGHFMLRDLKIAYILR